jgi:hypothetical protein
MRSRRWEHRLLESLKKGASAENSGSAWYQTEIDVFDNSVVCLGLKVIRLFYSLNAQAQPTHDTPLRYGHTRSTYLRFTRMTNHSTSD